MTLNPSGVDLEEESQEVIMDEIVENVYNDCIEWYMKGYSSGKIIGFNKEWLKVLLSEYTITRKKGL